MACCLNALFSIDTLRNMLTSYLTRRNSTFYPQNVCVAAYDDEIHFNFSNIINRFILAFERQSVYCETGFQFLTIS